MTAFSDIAAAIVAKLQEPTAVAGGRVYRGQAWPMPEGTASMAWVRIDTTTSDREGISGGPVDWTTTFAVELRARYAPDSQSPDAAVDADVGLIFEKLVGLSVPGMMDVIPGTTIEWDYTESDVNVVGVTVRVDVVHRTASSNLAAW